MTLDAALKRRSSTVVLAEWSRYRQHGSH